MVKVEMRHHAAEVEVVPGATREVIRRVYACPGASAVGKWREAGGSVGK